MPPKWKAAAAAAAAEPFAVEDLFTALNRHIQAGELHQAQVLAAAPGEEDAVRCKVVAHVKSHATDMALTTIRAAERLAIDLSYFKLQGQTQEAMETYVNMVNKKSGDPSSLAVATTNLISLKGTKDVADNLRKLDRLFEKSATPNQLQLIESLELKLSPRQKETMYSARGLLLHGNKFDQAHELVNGLIGMSRENVFPVLLQAEVHVTEKKVQKAE